MTSWSSRQHISQEDLAYLQEDLLALCIRLEKQDSNTMGIMTSTNFSDMTQIISTRNMLKDILINLEKELQDI